MKWIAILALLAGTQLQAATLFTEDFEQGLSKKWEPIKFEGLTEYKIIKDGGSSVLQARAASSASGLGFKTEFSLKPGTKFTWRWKLDKTPAGGSEDTKKTFDHTVRLFVAFKGGLTPRSINYVWANKTEVGKTFNHPSSNRARFVVLESGNAKAGQWITETRDLYADWQKLFGDETPPNVGSIGLMTDSDGTATTVTGWYDDLAVTTP